MFQTVPGEHIIDQGDDGDNFYVIDTYVFDLLVHYGKAVFILLVTYVSRTVHTC